MNLEESLNLVLKAVDCRVCTRFYEELFRIQPSMKVHFETTNLRHQAAILAMTMQAIVAYDVQEFTAISDYLKILGHKHFERGIPREEYGPFRDALLTVLAEFHGGDWTDELAGRWRGAIDRATQAMLKGYVEGPLFY